MKHDFPKTKRQRRFFLTILLCTLWLSFAPATFAAGGDPLAAINNLSEFIFSAIKALGVIILAWGIVQIGMSLQSHDASQRATGFLTFFGGLVIACTKEILDLVLA